MQYFQALQLYFVIQSATEESLIFSSLDAIVSMANITPAANTSDSTVEEDTFEHAVEKLKSLIVEKENTKICLEGVRWALFLFSFFLIFLVCCQLGTKKGSVKRPKIGRKTFIPDDIFPGIKVTDIMSTVNCGSLTLHV
jgi:hypothetical protein